MAIALLLHAPDWQVPGWPVAELWRSYPSCVPTTSALTAASAGAGAAGLVALRARSTRCPRRAKASDTPARGKVVVPMRRQNVVRPKREEDEEAAEPKTWASQAETPHPQRCDALCVADDLDLERVSTSWLGSAEQGALPHGRARRLSSDVMVLELEDGRLCFCFAFGSLVCWGFTSVELRRLRRLIRKSVGDSLPPEEIENDSMTFSMEDSQNELEDGTPVAPAPKLSGDHIVLMTSSGDEALAYSYAFAQSVKLAVFETIVDASIEKAKPIPEALAQYGTFDMDEKLVKMQMGEIFVTKCSLTLQTDMLGTPEILWEHDRFDAQYEACRKYLEVGKRVEILDQRLAVLNDLYSFL